MKRITTVTYGCDSATRSKGREADPWKREEKTKGEKYEKQTIEYIPAQSLCARTHIMLWFV